MSPMSNNENFMETTRDCSFQHLEHQVSSSSRGAESDDDHSEHIMMDASPSKYNHATEDKLREGRFDVGFPREQTSVPHWDMMQR